MQTQIISESAATTEGNATIPLDTLFVCQQTSPDTETEPKPSAPPVRPEPSKPFTKPDPATLPEHTPCTDPEKDVPACTREHHTAPCYTAPALPLDTVGRVSHLE